ncbi:MAG: hypothetical protein ABIR80_19560, partial [Opitutaceae bacterium]
MKSAVPIPTVQRRLSLGGMAVVLLLVVFSILAAVTVRERSALEKTRIELAADSTLDVSRLQSNLALERLLLWEMIELPATRWATRPEELAAHSAEDESIFDRVRERYFPDPATRD